MVNTKETVLSVDGMTCSSCIRHVEGALRTLDGIGRIEVELKAGRVRVQHDANGASVEEMIDALAAAGYESQTTWADPEIPYAAVKKT